MNIVISRFGYSYFIEDTLVGDFVARIKSLNFCSLDEVLFFYDLEGVFDIGIDIGRREEA